MHSSFCAVFFSFKILTKTRMGEQLLTNSQMSNCMKTVHQFSVMQTNKAVQLTHTFFAMFITNVIKRFPYLNKCEVPHVMNSV